MCIYHFFTGILVPNLGYYFFLLIVTLTLGYLPLQRVCNFSVRSCPHGPTRAFQSLGDIVPLCTILRFPQQQQPLQQTGQEVDAFVGGRGAGQRSDGRARGQRGRNGGTRGFHDGAPVEREPSCDCVCADARVMEGHLFHVYSHVCTLNHLYAENMMVRLHVLFSVFFSRLQLRLH